MTSIKKKIFFITFSYLLISSPCLAESIEDGLLEREDVPIYLQDGSTVPCYSFSWFSKTTDFIMCNQGGSAKEVRIEDVDLGKTFGEHIAAEYTAKEKKLSEKYKESKAEMEANVETQGTSPEYEQMLRYREQSIRQSQAIREQEAEIQRQIYAKEERQHQIQAAETAQRRRIEAQRQAVAKAQAEAIEKKRREREEIIEELQKTANQWYPGKYNYGNLSADKQRASMSDIRRLQAEGASRTLNKLYLQEAGVKDSQQITHVTAPPTKPTRNPYTGEEIPENGGIGSHGHYYIDAGSGGYLDLGKDDGSNPQGTFVPVNKD